MVSGEDKELYFDTCNEVTMALHLHRAKYYEYMNEGGIPHEDDWDLYEADYLEKVEIRDVVIPCPGCGVNLFDSNIRYVTAGTTSMEWVDFCSSGHIDYHDEEIICRGDEWHDCSECLYIIKDEDILGIEKFLFGLSEMPDVFVVEDEDDDII